MAQTNNVIDMPKRPNGVGDLRVVSEKTGQYVVVNGYSAGHINRLTRSDDDLELEIDLGLYDRMENDPTIIKGKRILTTNVLSDELQMSPGATEEQVGASEFQIYTDVMNFCERMVLGLDKPMRDTLDQLNGNAIAYGHGFAEVEWDYKIDADNRPINTDKKGPEKKKRFTAMMQSLGFWAKADAPEDPAIKRPNLRSKKMRLMPKSIKVKPRGSAHFVVDDFMNTLGMTPAYRRWDSPIQWNEIIDRDKFLVLTMNKKNEDPRGKSSYRAAFNAWNVKQQLPSEMLRFVLEEIVPKSIGTLAQDAPPFEFERDANDNVLYEYNPDGTLSDRPKMLTGTESMARQIKELRGGSGAVIPYGATLQPYNKNGNSDTDMFGKLLKVLNDEIENCILLQTLAQSEGAHQARSASQQVAELLHNLVFWIRWTNCVMLLIDFFEVGVRMNLGEWALKYMPMISLGDFVRRNWAEDLAALADAYFKGFLDDTQRAELMSWMNLPKPGPSRQELGMEQAAQLDPTTGEARKPNNQRPDKQAGTKNRNDGNGTEKKKNVNASNNTITGFSPLNSLGHHGRRAFNATRRIFTSTE